MQILSEDSSALEEKEAEQIEISDPLVRFVEERFQYAKTGRMLHEQRWIRAHYNYRGLYGKEIKFMEHEKSRAFVKITKTKVQAAHSQAREVIFAGNRVPISIRASKIPVGMEGDVFLDPQNPVMKPGDEENTNIVGVGYAGDGNPPKPGQGLIASMGAWLSDKLSGIPNAKVQRGNSDNPTVLKFNPAKHAAAKMDKKIQDQLDESNVGTHVSNALYECAMLGTGCIKGPFVVEKEYPKWDPISGVYTPERKDFPEVTQVSIWNLYPDPDATQPADWDFVVERSKMSAAALRALKKRPLFFKEAIDEVIEGGPNYTDEWWEFQLDEEQNTGEITRWEMKQYWGTIPARCLEHVMDKLPDNLPKDEEYQCAVFWCKDKLLRVIINPFTPQRIPYLTFPWELNPYSTFGVGVAENMEDSQTLMNGFTRLAIDNAVISSNLMLEVDETYLVPGQDMKTYPGKIWRRQGGPPGQAIFAIKWDNVTQETMMLFDRFRQMADETTGIPSFSHGSTGVMGTGRTAAGMQMLMGAAAMAIKDVIENADNFLFEPLGKAMFAWNMQFDPDEEIKGDLEVKATGTMSLMLREVKSQKLMQFLGIIANPMVAPFIKIGPVLREFAESMDIDPDDIINNPDEAKLQAMVLGLMQQQQAAPGGSPVQGSQPIGGPQLPGTNPGQERGSTQAPTPQVPGEQGFSAGNQPQKPNPQGQKPMPGGQ